MFIEYHRTMLGDRLRNEAFYRALKKVVKKGKTTVADIGSGTGLIGFMASKLGAKEVHLYEQGPVLALSQHLAKTNKIKRITFIAEHSTSVSDPDLVDVVVSETLGNYAFEEQIAETINDSKRFLKHGGKIIPEGIEQFVCPVVSSHFYKELTVWDDVGHGLDYSAAKELTLNNVYVRAFAKKDLLDSGAAAVEWDSANFYDAVDTLRQGAAEWDARKGFEVYGFAVWWKCYLTEGVSLTTSPLAPKTHWEQLYFPVKKPLIVKKGEILRVNIESESSYEDGTDIRWTTMIRNAKGKVLQKQSAALSSG